MSKRVKVEAIDEISESELEVKLSEYANLSNELEKIEAEMNLKVTAIRDKYLAKIDGLQTKQSEVMKVIHFWAEKNKERFEKKRSLEMQHGKIGFRVNTPKFKPRKGFTLAAITQLLKEYAPQFIRTKEEPDKESIIAKREEPEVVELLPKIGVDIIQDETFFIDLKKEEVL